MSVTDSTLHHGLDSTVKRVAKRARYDRAPVYALVDQLKMGHIAFVSNGRPVSIPMTVWRVDDHLYFHVANKSRLQKHLETGGEVCISFARYEAWIMSKSAYHHSANYRSAVLFCTGERVTEPAEFDRVFNVLLDQMEEGRSDQVRPANDKERYITSLMKLTINEGSFKQRDEGVHEEPEDLDLPVWNGPAAICPFSGRAQKPADPPES
ncbi:MAG: pyridoxamine 5'-phosphate oxidase family protein [Porticoccaceae bacterium]|nr:pyridoxamine 5'-phosphate oxidase family protein [Porticoccaceae bacterium]